MRKEGKHGNGHKRIEQTNSDKEEGRGTEARKGKE